MITIQLMVKIGLHSALHRMFVFIECISSPNGQTIKGINALQECDDLSLFSKFMKQRIVLFSNISDTWPQLNFNPIKCYITDISEVLEVHTYKTVCSVTHLQNIVEKG